MKHKTKTSYLIGLTVFAAIFFLNGVAAPAELQEEQLRSETASEFVEEYTKDGEEWAYSMEDEDCTVALLSEKRGVEYDPNLSKFGDSGWTIFFQEDADPSKNVCLSVRLDWDGDEFKVFEYNSARAKMEEAIRATGSFISKKNDFTRLWVASPNSNFGKQAFISPLQN